MTSQTLAATIKAAKNFFRDGIVESPAQLKALDAFISRNASPEEAFEYRRAVYGDEGGQVQYRASSPARADESLGETDMTPSHQKPGYDYRQNIPRGNSRWKNPKLEPPENQTAVEADEKARRSRWKRKNIWGATTGDPFKEMFGRNLVELTRENPDVPFMYRHLL